MANRLSPREAMYYFLDPTGATSHLGALLIFDDAGPPAGAAADGARHILDYPSLVSLVENRLQLAPRYRQIVLPVTMGLARPVWVDDHDFDINFHIRRSGLPRPGTLTELGDLIARVMSRPLDRSRPLWEMYLIEGLEGNGYAVLTKSHRCLVDDFAGPEISQVITDETAEVVQYEPDLWMPGHPPGATSLAIGALAEAVSRPGEFIDSVVTGNGVVGGVRTVVDSTVRRIGDLIGEVTDSAPQSPLNSPGSSSQMFAVSSVPRRDCAKIAEHHRCTVNDVVLAIVSGVMRRWLLSFDVAAPITDTVRVEIPLSTRDPGMAPDAGRDSTWIDVGAPGFVTDLPVGEDNPKVRLSQVAALADRYAQSSRRVTLGPRPLLPDLGMVPFPEFSSWAFRSLGTRGYNIPLSITSSPVSDRYVLGRKVSAVHAVPGLIAGHALSIGVVEYRDRLNFAFTADRGVIGDLPALAGYVAESFEELLGAQ
ncbi:wax ester/triacylglycerol synthase family O-acyltransferase [Gordonia sp. L191]|uniref:wax ester/triacylglycerol synthase domain-containing protein n=1 Tax=Gordonia sp. L191 TaxID=2982699 RepID=UPI0024C080E2|nr:wax ester/triacylglycerol synthase domain-containing protein [Gordonia sp. L191]WHU48444.1 wax ester/triacylglycerol synthase family O-acyltransferase [Gordonia sp. L191]